MHAAFKRCSKPIKNKKLGKYAISVFAKSVIADNYATLYVFSNALPCKCICEVKTY